MQSIEDRTWQGPGCVLAPLERERPVDDKEGLSAFDYENAAGQRFTITVRTNGADGERVAEFLRSTNVSLAADRLGPAGRQARPVGLGELVRDLPGLVEAGTRGESSKITHEEAVGRSVADLAREREWNWPLIREEVEAAVHVENRRRLADAEGAPSPALWPSAQRYSAALDALHLPGALTVHGFADGAPLAFASEDTPFVVASVVFDGVDGERVEPGVWEIQFLIDPTQSVGWSRTDVWIINAAGPAMTRTRVTSLAVGEVEHLEGDHKVRRPVQLGQDHHCYTSWISIRNTSQSLLHYELSGSWIQHQDEQEPAIFY